jgi:hypothetical protein
MLPLLLQFNGEPVVTEEGDLIYRFPDLMPTASTDGARDGARVGVGASDVVRSALGFEEPPPGWRPRLGDRVVLTQVLPRRQWGGQGAQNEAIARSLIGQVGAADWDGLACIGMHWHVLACIGMNWHGLACIGMHWCGWRGFQLIATDRC